MVNSPTSLGALAPAFQHGDAFVIMLRLQAHHCRPTNSFEPYPTPQFRVELVSKVRWSGYVQLQIPAARTSMQVFSQPCLARIEPMRSYPPDSPQAVSRLLALSVIIDGGGSPPEIAATYRIGILDHAGIEEHVFDQVLREMCMDLPTTPDGLVKVETEMIDQMLAEIVQPELRLSLWKAMWQLVYADEEVADAELALLLRATSTWGIETGANGSGQIAKSVPAPYLR
jgi:uncharacterized tellurite resistance protein B-like protein